MTTSEQYEVMLNTDIELNKISHHYIGIEEPKISNSPDPGRENDQSSKKLKKSDNTNESMNKFNSQALFSSPFSIRNNQN